MIDPDAGPVPAAGLFHRRSGWWNNTCRLLIAHIHTDDDCVPKAAADLLRSDPFR